MKIKTKKRLNLPQLIEHIWANNLRHKWKDSDNTSAYVQVYDDGQLVVDKCTKDSVFTVEVEEEITEDTKLNLLLDHFINPYGQHYVGNIHHNRSINDILEENDESEIATNFIHILDKETKEFKLIWRDGKLVE